MSDLLAQSDAWLNSQRHAHMTREVVYHRGDHSVTLAATVDSTVFRYDDRHGVAVRSESRDYIVRAADLVLDGERLTPRRGDLIRERDDQTGITYVHEVMSPTSDEPDWRWADGSRQSIRIHSRQIEQETDA